MNNWGAGAIDSEDPVDDAQVMGDNALAGEHALVSSDEATLESDLSRLDTATARLAGYEDEVDAGEYWGDLQTGRVEQGADTGVYSRIGPFRTIAEAQEALIRARNNADGLTEPLYRE